jgi:tRNA G10  N-methylase Trm11
MSEFNYKSVAILGRQPAIGVAELESLYGPDGLRRLSNSALLEVAAEEIDFKRLGGTIKVARILSVLPTTNWKELLDYLDENIPKHLEYAEPGKFTLGLSVYDLAVSLNELNRGVLQLKKAVKGTGRPVRIVPNKTLELNSAQVLHNKLTHRGAWELLLIRDNKQTIVAQTLFVQDIEAYAARDQARPKRDARVGMLPPKLAQTLVNLAGAGGGAILDPFCGTGVILQEALLMGYNVYGTDIEPRMIEYTQTNLEWLKEKYPLVAGLEVNLEAADATNHRWQHSFDAVATEVFLGRPLNSLPAHDKLKEIINDANTVIRKFLANLAPRLEKGTTLSLAVPAWVKPDGKLIHLPLIDQLTDMGYNRMDFKHVENAELAYYRKDQTVARELLVLNKS